MRGGQPVFDRLDLALGAGEALMVVGPNGAGKSSLLMVLGGLVPPAGGQFAVEGTDPEAARGSHIHYLGHRAGIRPGLSVEENLVFWCDVFGGTREKIAPALAAAGLGGLEALDAGVLSAGQTKRLALCRVLVAPRPLWLLDEPTSALDSQGAGWVAALVSAHLEAGGLAVIATHQPLGIEDRQGVTRLDMARTIAEPEAL